jgi:prepilin-type N-terminal cleavage/methylation domain-containing protein
MRYSRAFTLIELLVVISIVSLLSSVVLTTVSRAQSSARDAKRMIDSRNIMMAIARYNIDTGTYPLIGQWVSDNNTSGWSQLENELRPYLTSLPKDPRSPSFTYTYFGVPTWLNGGGYYFNAMFENPLRNTGLFTSYSYNSGSGWYGPHYSAGRTVYER